MRRAFPRELEAPDWDFIRGGLHLVRLGPVWQHSTLMTAFGFPSAAGLGRHSLPGLNLSSAQAIRATRLRVCSRASDCESHHAVRGGTHHCRLQNAHRKTLGVFFAPPGGTYKLDYAVSVS